MKIEIMIYVYMAICVSMIAFNIVYIFVLRGRNKNLDKNSSYFKEDISKQIENINDGGEVDKKHKKKLYFKLKRVSKLTAFDKALEELSVTDKDGVQKYICQIYSVFLYLATKYSKSDKIKAAYFPYVVAKYEIINQKNLTLMLDLMLDMLRSDSVYCRENALSAIYSTKDCNAVVKALKIIDTNKSFHHPKLICDGLAEFGGDKNVLADSLLFCFDDFSVTMQLNILNFLRFGGIRKDGKMLEILKDETADNELRYSAIRYFEKFYNEDAKETLQAFAEGNKDLPWQYQAIASSALKTYQDQKTNKILKNNLSSSNWYVRLNSAKSCEALGFTYGELIDIFDGDDRYAREIIRYRLDRHEAEKAAVTKCKLNIWIQLKTYLTLSTVSL